MVAPGVSADGSRKHFDQKSLCRSRHAFQKDVPAGDQGRQRALHDVVLADDHLGDLVTHLSEVGTEMIQLLFDGFSVAHRGTPQLVRGVRSGRVRPAGVLGWRGATPPDRAAF